MKTISIRPGVTLYAIPAQRFKTVRVLLQCYRPLTKEEATKNALLSRVLQCGTREYNTPAKLNCALEELYGASLAAGVMKKGEVSALTFGMEYVNGKFLDEPHMDERALSLFCDLMLCPATEDGGFSSKYVALERENLKNDLDALINDKREYATWRCKEEMCQEEAYSVFSYGDTAHLATLTDQELYEHYQSVFDSKIDIFVCGDTDFDRVADLFRQRLDGIGREMPYPETKRTSYVERVRRVTEELDVEQGKLVLGFRTGVEPVGKEYYALAVYNSVLGGGAHSKLFNQVREKESLAYYVSSQLDRYKGILMIGAGIEIEHFDRAYEEIMKQLTAMERGEITAAEMEAAKQAICHRLRALVDSPRLLMDYYAGRLLLGTTEELEEFIREMEAVTVEDIVQVAQKIQLDTVYFLRNKGGRADA